MMNDQFHHYKPSESLFVRSVLPFCKRIGPLWMKNAAIMRQEKRKQQRSGNRKNAKKKFKKEICSENEEVQLCVTLLRKLYREIKPNCLGDLMKAWMRNVGEECSRITGACVLTRGDAKGRMRRIDACKGADKVWRLDVLVSMLYHGLPLSSSENGIIIHTCQKELCIHPHHLKFRVSSISIALSLKVLSQKGYKIIKNPTSSTTLTMANNNKMEIDNIDLCGPFSIGELEELKNESVKIESLESYKLNSSPDDIRILENEHQLKQFYMKQFSNSKPVVLQSNTSSSITAKQMVAVKVHDRFNSEKMIEKHKCPPPEYSDENIEIIVVDDDDETVEIVENHNIQNKLKEKPSQFESTDAFEEKELIDILSGPEQARTIKKRRLRVTEKEREEKLPESGSAMNNQINSVKTEIEKSRDSWINFIKDNNSTLLSSVINKESEGRDSILQFEGLHSSSVFSRDRDTSLFHPLSSRCCSSDLKRRSCELYSKAFRDDEDMIPEFFDMLYSIRNHSYKRESSLKFTTPNIFSPTSEIEEIKVTQY